MREVSDFLAAVAEATPAPGGGTSAGVVAGLAAALVEMSARLGDRSDVAERARGCRRQALEAAEEELSSYAPVLEASGESERLRALAAASEPPARIAEVAAEVAELGADVAGTASAAVRGDALTGVILAEAAAVAAARLVEVNVGAVEGSPEVLEHSPAVLERARDAERRASKARSSTAAG